jgi:hypothetical protein
MRKPEQITVDRALLLYLLRLAEPHGLMSDVKLQQLAFLCELQMFNKGVKGFHFEFFRYAYGVFSKDLDNDLLSLRRKERVENFSPSDQAEKAITLLLEGMEKTEVNQQVVDILQAVVAKYGPQDNTDIMKSVEAVELSTPEQPEFNWPIRDISFHTTILVPYRIDVTSEFTLPPKTIAGLNAAMGYEEQR